MLVTTRQSKQLLHFVMDHKAHTFLLRGCLPILNAAESLAVKCRCCSRFAVLPVVLSLGKLGSHNASLNF